MRASINYFWAILLSVVITACGGNSPQHPTVSSVSPSNQATGVAVNTAITATFGQAMYPATITSDTFTVGGVRGEVIYSGNTATFTPAAPLANSTTYTATITTAVKDLGGNALASPYTWSFTTGAPPDTTPPTVASINPANNATGVAVNAAINATFSEAMNASTLTSGTFTVNGVTGTVTYSGNTATFTPVTNLANLTTYTATITTAVKDSAGNAMASPYTWSFTTGVAPDTTPPTVSSVTPANNATAVAVNSPLSVTFSEPMTVATITPANFTVDHGVTGAVTSTATTATFTPASILAYSTTYTATITTGVKDNAGNALASNYLWTFTTDSPPPPPAPTPAPAAPTGVMAVAGNGQVTISWNAVSGAASYNLYMASVSGVTKNNYKSLTDGMQHVGVISPYIHSGMTNGKPYYFVVTAVNGNGEGIESTQVSATPQAAPVAASNLNDTGVTSSQCYQAGSDVLVVCGSAGAIALNNAQDGMVGRDANTATNNNSDGKLGFSFTRIPAQGVDTGSCVLDNVTGLMWEVKTADGGLRDWTKTYTNYSSTSDPVHLYGTPTDAQGFVASVNAINLCGYNDWRLPTIEELRSIVDFSVGYPGPTIDASWFPNTNRYGFWSASPYVGSSEHAWETYFGDGSDGVGGRYMSLPVLLVRAGEPPIPVRFTVSANGQEVTDNKTKLVWRRCAEGMVYSGDTCTGTASTFTHEAALQHAATQATSTRIAWRLPNVKELTSIADIGLSNPAIDSMAFPATPPNWFWTSSPLIGGSNRAWTIFFVQGGYFHDLRTRSISVRLVRSGS